MAILKTMTDEDLKSIGINTFGKRWKILQGITRLLDRESRREDMNLANVEESNRQGEEGTEDRDGRQDHEEQTIENENQVRDED